MFRSLRVVCFCLAIGFVAVAFAAEGQGKTGVIKSVDAKAKTFVVDLPARPLTFTWDDKTVITLDGKESTADAAIKPDFKATVTYKKDGDARLASKIEVKTPEKK